MTCVRTIKCSVIINGQAYSEIIPSQGLRQGDPLSPYFFILYAEGLSSALWRNEWNGGITGLPITQGGTRLNHLFFADDSFLFCKAKEEDLTCIQETLDMYEKASGQIKQREDLDIFQLKH